MRLVVILFVITLVRAIPQVPLHQQEQENNHLNPINDAAAKEEAARLQNKRTLFGATHYLAKHVGVHPLGFKYILGYGPIAGYYPYAKPVTLLKPVLHSGGWKPIIQNVPVFRPIKPIAPVVPVGPQVHQVHPVVPIQPVQPIQPVVPTEPVVPEPVPVFPVQKHIPEPVAPVNPFIKPVVHIQPQFPVGYPFFKPLFNTLLPQPPVVQPAVHFQPHVVQQFVPQPAVPQPVVPQQFIPQPVVPQQFIPQPVVPHHVPIQPFIPQPVVPQPPVVQQLPPALYHILKTFPQHPGFRHVTQLFPINHPVPPQIHPIVPVPELPKFPLPQIPTQDSGVSVQIPQHLPEHPQFPLQPEVGHGVQVHQPDFHTEHHAHGQVDNPVLIPHHPGPSHPAPQTPLYLPPHPVFRPGVANPVGPVEATNSIHTEFSATFPKHPLIPGLQHPSISLEPPYGPPTINLNKH